MREYRGSTFISNLRPVLTGERFVGRALSEIPALTTKSEYINLFRQEAKASEAVASEVQRASACTLLGVEPTMVACQRRDQLNVRRERHSFAKW